MLVLTLCNQTCLDEFYLFIYLFWDKLAPCFAVYASLPNWYPKLSECGSSINIHTSDACHSSAACLQMKTTDPLSCHFSMLSSSGCTCEHQKLMAVNKNQCRRTNVQVFACDAQYIGTISVIGRKFIDEWFFFFKYYLFIFLLMLISAICTFILPLLSSNAHLKVIFINKEYI